MKTRMGFLYGTLVALLVIMGLWWTYFLTAETHVQADLKLQRMNTDKLHASFLLQADPRLLDAPDDRLKRSFPHLIFHRNDDGFVVHIDPQEIGRAHV